MTACRIGLIGPTTRERINARLRDDPNLRGEPLLPPEITFVYEGFQIVDYTPEGVEAAVARYWEKVAALSTHSLDRIGWSGFPISVQLGRPRCLQMLKETELKTGLVSFSDAEDVVLAMKYLGVRKIAVASRWAEGVNQAVTRYFNSADIEVVAITSVGQMAAEAFSMSLDRGIKLVFELSRRAMKSAPGADALFVPGGTWRALGCLPPLEEEFGIPVLSNGTAQVWRVMHDGLAPAVQGWTKLLENPGRSRQ